MPMGCGLQRHLPYPTTALICLRRLLSSASLFWAGQNVPMARHRFPLNFGRAQLADPVGGAGGGGVVGWWESQTF